MSTTTWTVIGLVVSLVLLGAWLPGRSRKARRTESPDQSSGEGNAGHWYYVFTEFFSQLFSR